MERREDPLVKGAIPSLRVPFAPSKEEEVIKALKLADIGENDVVYDLGSGDGRILLKAIEKFGAKAAIGVEIDPHLVNVSRALAKTKGLEEKVVVIHDDLFRVDLSKADVVTLYLSPWMNSLLRAKLERELLKEINSLGIGPQGWGGKTTALAVHLECQPTHIACLPLAINIDCHAHRVKSTVI